MIRVDTDGVSASPMALKDKEVVGDLTAGLGRVITDLRCKKGMRQIDLALVAGMSRPTIANIEAGKQGLTVLQLLALADAIGLNVTVTFEDKQ